MYTVPLQLAAQCCWSCSREKDPGTKGERQKEMRQYLEKADASLHADWMSQSVPEGEYYFAMEAILNCQDKCRNCQKKSGSKGASISKYLDRKVIKPYRSEVVQTRREISREERDLEKLERERAKAKQQGTLSFEAALIRQQDKRRMEKELEGVS